MYGDEPMLKIGHTASYESSPYARGWTCSHIYKQIQEHIYPVRTGMNLDGSGKTDGSVHLPRMHGDEPWIGFHPVLLVRSAPYARGWTGGEQLMDIKKYICPVRTGMNPSPTVLRSYCKNIPRMHGDEPMKLEAMKHQRESAPYTRG